MDYSLMKEIYFKAWGKGFQIPVEFGIFKFVGTISRVPFFSEDRRSVWALHHKNFPPFEPIGKFIENNIDFNKFNNISHGL